MSFLKKRQKCPGSGFGSRPESRGPQGALGGLKKMPDRYALFYALFMSEKAGPKKEEFNSNVGISTCKKYIGTGEARYVVHYFHISFLRNQGEIMEYISSQKSQYLKSNQFVFVGAAAHFT